jgi:hypothetical protein
LFLTPIEVASACDFIRKLEEELKKNAKARETRKSEKAQAAKSQHRREAGVMQLVGCDRIHEEAGARRTGATTPRESMPKRRRTRPRINNAGYSTATIATAVEPWRPNGECI